MDVDTLRQLEQQAIESALKSGQVTDLEKAVNIARTVVETQKVIADSTHQPQLLRYEEFKTLAALLVPFLSIATLAVTIYIQAAQLKATREANDATEWREVVKNVLGQLSRPPSVVADPALAMSLLEPYTSNSRFGKDAALLSIELLSRVPSSDRFRDFLLSHHLGESWGDVQLLTDLNRELYADFREVEQRLTQPSPPDMLKFARDPLLEDIEFTTEKLCALYRTPGAPTRSAEFRDVFVLNGDLHDVDLTAGDLTGAKLQSVNLTNARLAGEVKFKGVQFVDSNWWDASDISRPLLDLLLDNNYPYFDNEGVIYNVPPPNKQTYIERVVGLCHKANVDCDPKQFKYGEPLPPEPHEK